MIITPAVVALSVGGELLKIQLHWRRALRHRRSTAEKMIGSRTSVGGCEEKKRFQTLLSLELRLREGGLCVCVVCVERNGERVRSDGREAVTQCVCVCVRLFACCVA